MDEKKIIKAFNQGYTIQRHHPKLAEKLLKGMEGQKSNFITAFIKGSEECLKEKEKPKTIKMNYRLKEHNLPKIEKNRNKNKGKEK